MRQIGLWGCDPMRPMAGESVPTVDRDGKLFQVVSAHPTGRVEKIDEQTFEEFETEEEELR